MSVGSVSVGSENNNDPNNGTGDTNTRLTIKITKFIVHRYQIISLFIITVNREYSTLVLPLTDLEYASLKNSIKENSQYDPATVSEKGVIYDGHHRLKICNELKIPLKYVIKTFKDSIEEKKFIIEINLKRRQLNDYQKGKLAYKLEEIESERAKLRQIELAGTRPNINNNTLGSIGHKVDNNNNNQYQKGRTRKIVSNKVDLSQGTYQRIRYIIKHGSEETKTKLDQGKSTINKEYNKTRKDQKRAEFLSQMNSSESNGKKTIADNCKLILGDFREKGREIEDNSIDLIFTDPPYSQEFLYLYEDLARLAVRVLKPRGSLVTYVGNISLTEIIKIFDSQQPGLKFWWQFVVKHNGGHQRIHARNVFARYKSLLWYVKGEKPNELVVSNNIGDFIESSPPSKILHDWEQSPIEPEYVIKNLTLENQSMVLDPMMGLGTTGVASILLNRKFIGIEKNEDTFKIAQSRITKEELAKKE